MQKNAYKNGTNDHLNHNNNNYYWDFFVNNKIKGFRALDFACGKGRNINNLIESKKFNEVHGVDISEKNIVSCRERFKGLNVELFINDGLNLNDLKSNNYNYVMSTIALQHIPVYQIRYQLFEEIFRVLKSNGVFRFQMGYGPKPKKSLFQVFKKNKLSFYHENSINAKGTNSLHDVRVDNFRYLEEDLEQIGFKSITHKITDSFDDNQHPKWIYVEAFKLD